MKQFLAIVFSLFAVSAVAAPGGADRARNFDSAYGARALFSDPGERAAAEYRLFHSFPSPYGASTPAYWLRSDYFYSDLGSTLCTNGQKVEQASDVSGNGVNFVQATSGNRPTFTTGALGSYASATFVSANSQYLQNASSLVPETIIIVGRLNVATNTTSSIFGSQATGGGDFFGFDVNSNDGNRYQQAYIKQSNASFPVVKTNRCNGPQFYIMAVRTDGSSSMQYEVNAAILNTTSISGGLATCAGPTNLGASWSGSSPANFLDGDVCELLVYNTELSNAEIAQVYLALKNRYWPALAPAAYNFPNFTINGGTTGLEYGRFFTSTDGLALTEQPFSCIPARLKSGFRDPAIFHVPGSPNGPYFLAYSSTIYSSGWQTGTSFEIAQSDRLNGPYGYLCTVDCSSIATGSASVVAGPKWFYDPSGGNIYLFVQNASTSSGSKVIANWFGFWMKASDKTMTSWSTPTAIGGMSGITSAFYDASCYYSGGTYFVPYVDGNTATLNIASSSSPTSGYTLANGSVGFTANTVESPSLINIGTYWRMYMGGYNESPAGEYYSSSAGTNIGTAAWAAPANTTAFVPHINNGQVYVTANDPPAGGGPTTTGVGIILPAPWDWIPDLWIHMEVRRAA